MNPLTDVYVFLLILSGSILMLGILAAPIISNIFINMSDKELGIKKDKSNLFSLGPGMDFTTPIDDKDDYLYHSRPMNLYRSSYEDTNPDRDDVFRQYDESRRISEDIQQFHESHPDADLSDHYSWEDILDAESDGYLDEDDD